ncbi:ankyrin repeat and lem domain-containing protein 1 [Plakobranchus ocellatus]|uniref:Ankyrin repeat and lem domain-containing protein 1 n=1 Tax=Plakobranchus ocellatus TaxID=259542 RepID=A0AAV4C027_9GAST|nr:ankyrin repeat and lem domain-containing protein 1 [Plakobranchus ocellatus]
MDGTTPLHVAASWGCTSAVLALLQHGASSTCQDENGKTPYDLALEGGSHDCASQLLPKCLKVSSPLTYAADKSPSSCTLNSPKSPQTITQKLYRYLEQGTPVYFDATSPDRPCLGFKHGHCAESAKAASSCLMPKNISYESPLKSKPSFPGKREYHSPLTSPNKHTYSSCSLHSIHDSPRKVAWAPQNFQISHDLCCQKYQHFLSQHCCVPNHNSPICCSASTNSIETNLQSHVDHKFLQTPLCSNSHHVHPPSHCSHLAHSCPINQFSTCIHNHDSGNGSISSGSCFSCSKPSVDHISFEKESHLGKKIETVESLMTNSADMCRGSVVNKNANVSETLNRNECEENRNRCGVAESTTASGSQENVYVDYSTTASNVPRSLLKSQYSSALASPAASPHDKVAAFVLSTADFMSQCNIKDTNQQASTSVLSINNDSKSGSDQTISDSSINTFETCSESLCCVSELVKEKEKELNLPKLDENALTNSKKAHGEVSIVKAKLPLSQWKPPCTSITTDLGDIISSDESYLTHRSPRIYRMKIRKPVVNEDENYLKNGYKNMFSPGTVQIKQKVKSNAHSDARSDDSIFSNVTAKEIVVRDKESGIVFIEKHTPSVSGGSVGRRSLDSVSSAATVDSQGTLIYDWRTLAEISKPASTGVVSKRSRGQTFQSKFTNNTQSFMAARSNDSPASSGSSSNAISQLLASEDELIDSDIPDHLAKLSCDEISQELRKYGELPGPVIASTRQVYLRRLTSLEANPGLVTLTGKNPDYPLELRQALEGRFDASHLPILEAKMVEEFVGASTSNKQWREGTVKSSFTYLLLDPRVTENLPLRAKEMTDLEVFKTFICAIFYIGKGKRARPYSHLHEAVRQMNKNSLDSLNKMSKKVHQVIEIWKAGLGVVSLHCFQSVIPVEAYTREACMIEAIGIHKLTNLKRGDFYGVSATWSMQLRRQIGVYLLQKALQIFLAEGERQICLPDLCS